MSHSSQSFSPSFLVASVIFTIFTVSGIVSAAWVDAPNAPPNYGITGCTYPCEEEDFRPMNLGTTDQTKRAGATFEGNIIANGFLDRQDAAYLIDPESSAVAGNFKGAVGISTGPLSVGISTPLFSGAKIIANNPETPGKTGSLGDGVYAFASSTNAAISAEQGNPSGYGVYSLGGINYFGGDVGIGVTNPTEALEASGRIKSSLGGFVFPDGTTQYTAAALLMRAMHTFKDCVTQGGQVYAIDEGKNICRFPALPAGWTQYPVNWTTTQNVVCNDTKDAPEGWESPPTRTPCNTGSHSFADLPTESCTATSTGTQCWYEGWFGSNKVCGSATTSTTCYATVVERGGY